MAVLTKCGTLVGVEGTPFTLHLTQADNGQLPDNAIARFTLQESDRGMMLASGFLEEYSGAPEIVFDGIEEEDMVMPFFGESLPDLASAIYGEYKRLF